MKTPRNEITITVGLVSTLLAVACSWGLVWIFSVGGTAAAGLTGAAGLCFILASDSKTRLTVWRRKPKLPKARAVSGRIPYYWPFVVLALVFAAGAALIVYLPRKPCQRAITPGPYGGDWECVKCSSLPWQCGPIPNSEI